MSGLPIQEGAMLRAIENALREDVGAGDITTESIIPPAARGAATFHARANGVLAGLQIAETAFLLVDEAIRFSSRLRDGMPLLRGARIATVEGSVASILTAERVALNFLQRMSGIATMTASFVKLAEGTGAAIVDTRKTAPGLRAFDKAAVRMGGGKNHRFGLDDMVLIKDNHIAAAGSIEEAVRAVLLRLPQDRTIKIEVECESLAQLSEALGCEGVDVIMLDNFSIEQLRTGVRMIRAARPGVTIEASGNVNEQTVRAIAECGVDMISVGALTHSVKALDISLEFDRPA
jgi:nicotinate-nucleotide pyrophosphorylase (carboxylating)